MGKRDIYKIVILILLIAVGIFFFIHYDLHMFFSDQTKIIAFLHGFGPVSVFVFIGIQILQVLVAPIPGEVTGFIGGYIYGIYLGTVYSTIGLTVGSWLAFTLSRTLGLPFVERIVSPKIINQYDHIMAHQGPWVAFLLFLIPGFPKDALCYVLGLSHIRIGVFLVISTVGRLLGTLMLSIQGSFLRSHQDTTFLVVMSVSIIAAVLAYFFGKRWYKKHRKPHPPARTDREDGPKQG
jgi:uncharacterized membrane protein YdjX (TVP38/TMEM64 family)